jgi:hypothetical protein
VWASEAELTWTAADRAMMAAHDADQPLALAGDTDSALDLASSAAALLEPRLEDGDDELRGMYGALQLHLAITAAQAGREGDAWRYWDAADATARRIGGYFLPGRCSAPRT